MYTELDLNKYNYFKNVLEKTSINNILDSLTGLINRGYFIDFIQDLIDKNIEFTLAIIDLDNFKNINDNYGHIIGDDVLRLVGQNLISFMGEKGLAARYGGDEFLIIRFCSYDYEFIHGFYEDMYIGKRNIFRRNLKLQSCKPFVTATIGSASFPHDAKNYDELFNLIDKTLYRGKTKGRNCYIIYVEEKHKDLVVEKIQNYSICTLIEQVTNIFDSEKSLIEKLNNSFRYIGDSINIYNAFYIDNESELFGLIRSKKIAQFSNLKIDLEGNFLSIEDINELNKYSFFKIALETLDINSILLTRIKKDTEHGYLLFADKRTNRLWQEDEKALLFYMARLVAENLETK